MVGLRRLAVLACSRPARLVGVAVVALVPLLGGGAGAGATSLDGFGLIGPYVSPGSGSCDYIDGDLASLRVRSLQVFARDIRPNAVDRQRVRYRPLLQRVDADGARESAMNGSILEQWAYDTEAASFPSYTFTGIKKVLRPNSIYVVVLQIAWQQPDNQNVQEGIVGERIDTYALTTDLSPRAIKPVTGGCPALLRTF